MGARLLDVVLPPRCPSCLEIVPADGNFCATCWTALHFLSDPQCVCCGTPFAYDVGPDAICAKCAATPPAYDSARAAFAYNEVSARLILGLKYGDRPHLARILAGMTQRAASHALAGSPLIVPVPLHRKRLRQRFYNQAGLIAVALGKMSHTAVRVDLLKRTRPTATSRGMSARQRLENVRGAFEVPEIYRDFVQDSHILLVDDVFTTGATVEICARTLKRAGASRVDIVTIARVIHDISGRETSV